MLEEECVLWTHDMSIKQGCKLLHKVALRPAMLREVVVLLIFDTPNPQLTINNSEAILYQLWFLMPQKIKNLTMVYADPPASLKAGFGHV